MDRRDFLKTCAARTGALALCGKTLAARGAAGPSGRPNILWLIAEDFCPELACYGQGLVMTPNLDRLASEGVRYTAAFSTAPVCSPARSALMTGMYQTSIGAHQHRTIDKKPLPEGVGMITDFFREAGYFTSNCHFGRWSRPGKRDFNFLAEKPFDGTDWRRRPPGRPFFSLVQFGETTRDFKRDPESPIDPGKVALPPYYPDHPLARRDFADYIECIQVLDKNVGAVLQRLEEDGLLFSTAVFFFSDHGRPHVRGKQWLYDGGIHIPLIVRFPDRARAGEKDDRLLSAVDLGPAAMGLAGIEPPARMEGRGFLRRNGEERKYIVAARDRCDETYDRIRCVRTRRYKYIRNDFPNLAWTQTNLYKRRRYPVLTLMEVLYAQGKLAPEQARFMAPFRPAEELYDLEADPDEIRNLAGDGEHASRLKEMRGVLDEWIAKTGDAGRIPEDPHVAALCFLEIHRPNNDRVMRRRGLAPNIDPAAYLRYWEERLV